MLKIIPFLVVQSFCQHGGHLNLSRWQRAIFLLFSEEMNVTGLNSAISACGKRGQWQWALYLMACASDRRLPLDNISYNSAMSACGKGKQWQMAVALFEVGKRARVYFVDLQQL